ncbi:MAG: helix-turn-helix domain-containing protein [Lachnospiraceae bacterium]|nr:helix-turn-helix domain-containing protein [Lachnospiraceae bacterium]
MSTFLKRNRVAAGLTQSQLAEKMNVSVVAVQNWENGKTNISLGRYEELAGILNVSVDTLVKEMIIDENKKKEDNWPDFLFDNETNNLIDTLHLNMAQQELFGMLYLYVDDFRKYDGIDRESYDEYLKLIPYEFIKNTGIIQFMNHADSLYKVLKHVRTDFLLKTIKLNPYTEFNIRKLPKELICDFIDAGFNEVDITDDEYWYSENLGSLYFQIDMRNAKIMLPILEKFGKIHLGDGKWNGKNPIREDIPEEVKDGIIEMLMITREGLEAGYFTNEYKVSNVIHSLDEVTKAYIEASDENEERIMLEINDKGKELLRWFNNEEEKTGKKEKHRSVD